MTTTVTDHNVLAVKLGTHADRVIVIGGHYDSRTIDPVDPTDRAPGANDSGSQTALVLEAARVMAGYTFDATLIFAAFAAEEQGLAGSAQLAKDYANYVIAGAKVEAMLNCDIVGGDTEANNATTLKQFRLFSPGTPRGNQYADRPDRRHVAGARHHALHRLLGRALCAGDDDARAAARRSTEPRRRSAVLPRPGDRLRPLHRNGGIAQLGHGRKPPAHRPTICRCTSRPTTRRASRRW